MPRLDAEALDRLLRADETPGAMRGIDRARRRDEGRAERARRARRVPPDGSGEGTGPRPRPFARPNEREPFKCGRCRVFIGPTVSGGRHRNHCPWCLTSRHVDERRPGDRSSPCRALMAPVGTLFKRDGEQVVLHRCNGCGVERRCRVAADDDPTALLRLPPVAPAVPAVLAMEQELGESAAGEEEAMGA